MDETRDDTKSGLEKDTSYSPASDTETEQLQQEPTPDGVEVLPGTGGPDDVGDVDLAESDEASFRSEIGADDATPSA